MLSKKRESGVTSKTEPSAVAPGRSSTRAPGSSDLPGATALGSVSYRARGIVGLE